MRALLIATLVCVTTAARFEPYANYTKPVINVLDNILYFLANDANVTSDCRNSTLSLIKGAGDGTAWARRLIDASGKPSAGLLQNTAAMPGYFTECLGTSMENGESGKHCMMATNVTPQPLSGEGKKGPWNMLKEISLQIGLCVPSTCSDEDITRATTNAFTAANNQTTVQLLECHTNQNGFLQDPAAIVMTVIICLLLLIAVVATVYDILKEPERPIQCYVNKASSVATISTDSIPVTRASVEILCEEKIPPSQRKSSRLEVALLCFSLKTNGEKILKTQKVEGSIDSLHGIRFLSMLWIIIGHTASFALQWLLLRNTSLGKPDWPISFPFQIIANGTLSVDTFLFLSGFLVTYLTLKKMKKSEGKLNILALHLHRYIRMTPLMMVIIGFCACILRYVGNGPKWFTVIMMYDSWCKKNWWLNLLYVQNFFNTPNMCLAHTWYSAVDMQCFIISPFIIYALFKWKRCGLSTIAVLMTATVAITAVLTAVKQYPAIPYVAPIVSEDHMNDYYGTVYIKPYCRIGPYLVGMLLGYILWKRSDPVISKQWVLLGWTSCIATNLFIIYIMWPANNGVLPSTAEAAAYSSLARIIWGVTLAWITYACATGYGGFINTFLSWRVMIPLSRLTYSAYLIHPVIIALCYGNEEIVIQSSYYSWLYFAIGHLVITYVVSLFLSLIFESPIIGLEKVLLRT